jgi:hypothetical protein
VLDLHAPAPRRAGGSVIARLDRLVLGTRDRAQRVGRARGARVVPAGPRSGTTSATARRRWGPDGSRRPRSRRRPARASVVLLVALGLPGCASTLPYQPAEQPAGITISADVGVADGRLRVTIATDGYRVERAVLVQPDGAELAPETLRPDASRTRVVLGLGVGATGAADGGSYAVDTGVGIPLGAAAADRVIAVFPLDRAGPAPWRLRVKVVGIQPVDILLGRREPAGS